jgi:hypothetical protein
MLWMSLLFRGVKSGQGDRGGQPDSKVNGSGSALRGTRFKQADSALSESQRAAAAKDSSSSAKTI